MFQSVSLSVCKGEDCLISIYAEYPTSPFFVSKSRIDEFYEVQERRETDFKAPRLWKVSSGIIEHKEGSSIGSVLSMVSILPTPFRSIPFCSSYWSVLWVSKCSVFWLIRKRRSSMTDVPANLSHKNLWNIWYCRARSEHFGKNVINKNMPFEWKRTPGKN